MRTSCGWLPTILVFTTAWLPLAAGAAPRSYVDHKVPPGSPQLPFSDAVLAGDTLYVAGHLGIDPHTGSAPADAAAEARLVMDAVKHTLESAGLTLDDLVSPARAFIGSDKLLRSAHFEVQGVAMRATP